MKIFFLIILLFISDLCGASEPSTIICNAKGEWFKSRDYIKKYKFEAEQIVIFEKSQLISIENTFLKGYMSSNIDGEFIIDKSKFDFIKYEMEETFDDNKIHLRLGIKRRDDFVKKYEKWELVGKIYLKINRKSGSLLFYAEDIGFDWKKSKIFHGNGKCKKLINKF